MGILHFHQYTIIPCTSCMLWCKTCLENRILKWFQVLGLNQADCLTKQAKNILGSNGTIEPCISWEHTKSLSFVCKSKNTQPQPGTSKFSLKQCLKEALENIRILVKNVTQFFNNWNWFHIYGIRSSPGSMWPAFCRRWSQQFGNRLVRKHWRFTRFFESYSRTVYFILCTIKDHELEHEMFLHDKHEAKFILL